jgi:ATP-binding cassette subfamily B protein
MDPDGPWSPYEVLGVAPVAPPPLAAVDPDTSGPWWRRLWPLLRARRVAFFGSLLAALLATVAGVLLPRVTMQAIDLALVDRTEPLSKYLWLLGGLGAFRAVLTYGYRSRLYRVAYGLEYDLRTIVYGHLTRLSFEFFDRVQSGQLISRANSDIRSVQIFLTFAPMIAITFAGFFVALALMLTISLPLTIVALLPLPFVFVAGRRLRDQIFPLSWVVQARLAEVATVVDENVNGVRVVKGFAAEEREVNKLAKAAQRLRWASIEQADARARWGPLMENLPRFGLAAVLLYGGWLVMEGQVTIGALVAFNAYVVLMQAPFRFLGFIILLGQRAAASAGRLYEILDERPVIVDRPGAVDLVDPAGVVEFRDVTFGYAGKAPTLEHFSLPLQPGETVALVGRTGSGKSTVARLLLRFYDVTAGAVLVDGHDVRDVTVASLRHHAGVVLDEPYLFSDTIRANIAYARPDAVDDDIVAAAKAAQADAFIRSLPGGYDTVIGERGYDLSGGQRQRVSIARTLLANPRILVLDDATSAVDVKVEERIHAALRTLVAGRTTLVIAHRLSTIALADRVVLLEGGRIVAAGTHAALLSTEPRYAAVLARYAEEDAAAASVGDAGELIEDELAAIELMDGADAPAAGDRLGADAPAAGDRLDPVGGT